MSEAPPCPTCGKTGFASVAGMKRHHSLQHGESIAGEIVDCSHCGSKTRVRPYELEKYDDHYCDDDCRVGHLSEKNSGEDNPNYRGALQTYDCHQCGADVEKYPSHVVGRVFCSSGCRSAWMSGLTGEDSHRWNRINVPCDYCGADMSRRPSRVARHDSLFCSDDCRHAFHGEAVSGDGNPNYRHGGSKTFQYGSNWEDVRAAIITRDDETCQMCGLSQAEHYEEYGGDLHVHHKTPLVEFDNCADANDYGNLIALCVTCHGIAEQT